MLMQYRSIAPPPVALPHICRAVPVVQFDPPPCHPPVPVPPVNVNVPFITVSQSGPLGHSRGQPCPICGGPFAGKNGTAGQVFAVEIPLIGHVHAVGQLHKPQGFVDVAQGRVPQLVGLIVMLDGQPDPSVEVANVNVLL
jgi:hypothetical protein